MPGGVGGGNREEPAYPIFACLGDDVTRVKARRPGGNRSRAARGRLVISKPVQSGWFGTPRLVKIQSKIVFI
jgi:hypothetical protein